MTGPPSVIQEASSRPGRGVVFPWSTASGLGPSNAAALPLSRLAIASAIVAVLLVYVAAFQATWIDDAYIQLRYARTLLESGTWGFYAGYSANTATSPLNVILITAAGFLLGSVERAVIVLTALELAGLLWLLLRLSRHLFGRNFFGWFAFVALATNLFLLSTIGMESLLYVLLFVAALVCFLEARSNAMAVALGLLTLARPDGVLLLAVLLPFVTASLRQKATGLLLYAATIAPWFVFSWIHLGSLVPDTLLIKMGDAAWGPSTFADGPGLYLRRFPLETMASLFLVPLCVFPLRRCGPQVVRAVTVLAVYGTLHFVVYELLGVPPYHWYFVHQLVPMLLIASMGATFHLVQLDGAPIMPWLKALVVLPAAGLLVLAWDEGFPLAEAPINTNWARSAQYLSIAEWLRKSLGPTEAVQVHGEIGTVAYASDRFMINEFSDMSRADGLIEQAGYKNLPGVGPLMRFNFLWRQDHPPLPAPSFEFVPVPHDDWFPRCPQDDPACKMVWAGTSEWLRSGTKWFALRAIE